MIDADLDFAGNSINPVGINTAGGFKGTLFGGKHSVKNAILSGAQIGNEYFYGLFSYTQGAQIYDLSVDASVKMNSSSGTITTGVTSQFYYVGNIVGKANVTTLINCASNASYTFQSTSTTGVSYYCLGGIVGETFDGSFYYCSYSGNITGYASAQNTSIDANDLNRIGGLVGSSLRGATGSLVMSGCYVKSVLTQHFGGPNMGGLFARTQATINISNCYIDCDISMPSAPYYSADCGVMCGLFSSGFRQGGKISNVFANGNYSLLTATANCNEPYTTYVNEGCANGTIRTSCSSVTATFTNATKKMNKTDVNNEACSVLSSCIDDIDGSPTPKFAPFFLFYF